MKVALAKAGKTLHVDDEALERIAADGYSLAFGARFLKRFIDEQIKLPHHRALEGRHALRGKGRGTSGSSLSRSFARIVAADGTIAYSDVAWRSSLICDLRLVAVDGRRFDSPVVDCRCSSQPVSHHRSPYRQRHSLVIELTSSGHALDTDLAGRAFHGTLLK